MNQGAVLLRAWRGQRPQMDVAYALGIHVTELSRLENGHAVPNRQRAIVLRDVAQIPVDAWDRRVDEE